MSTRFLDAKQEWYLSSLRGAQVHKNTADEVSEGKY
jgi:hypothetical protein